MTRHSLPLVEFVCARRLSMAPVVSRISYVTYRQTHLNAKDELTIDCVRPNEDQAPWIWLPKPFDKIEISANVEITGEPSVHYDVTVRSEDSTKLHFFREHYSYEVQLLSYGRVLHRVVEPTFSWYLDAITHDNAEEFTKADHSGYTAIRLLITKRFSIDKIGEYEDRKAANDEGIKFAISVIDNIGQRANEHRYVNISESFVFVAGKPIDVNEMLIGARAPSLWERLQQSRVVDVDVLSDPTMAFLKFYMFLDRFKVKFENEKIAFDMITYAELFHVQPLKTAAIDYLKAELHSKNAISVLQFAADRDLQDLEQMALKLCRKSAKLKKHRDFVDRIIRRKRKEDRFS